MPNLAQQLFVPTRCLWGLVGWGKAQIGTPACCAVRALHACDVVHACQPCQPFALATALIPSHSCPLCTHRALLVELELEIQALQLGI
jgi:hypothetical protein